MYSKLTKKSIQVNVKENSQSIDIELSNEWKLLIEELDNNNISFGSDDFICAK